MKSLALTRAQWNEMERHLDGCLPLEGCGLLAGKDQHVLRVIPVNNDAHSPTRFRMAPADQWQALQEIEANGLDLVGIFHSHPRGPSAPSATDIAEAAYDVAQLIWSRESGAWQVAGFWIEQSRVADVKLELADGG